MARNFFAQTNSAAQALAAATTETLLQLVAPANQIVAVQAAYISFDGNSNTAVPVKVDILRQTTAGTASARNPLKTKDRAAALQTTGQETFTAEPTAGDIIKTFYVHPQAGAIIPLPLEREIEIPGGGRLGIRATAPAVVNALATFEGEE